jgi:hypothetical protein
MLQTAIRFLSAQRGYALHFAGSAIYGFLVQEFGKLNPYKPGN